MKIVTKEDIASLYIPPSTSHKGENGKLLIVGGSHFFHAASLWSLEVASRIVDLVHYASVPENNELVQQAKQEFRNGIVVHREDIERYIEEDDAILIGPGMVRKEETTNRNPHEPKVLHTLSQIVQIIDEGTQTEELTNYVLQKYPQKKWVIDAGALQMVNVELIPKGSVLTPHHGEFASVFARVSQIASVPSSEMSFVEQIQWVAHTLHCIVLVKGKEDVVCNGTDESQKSGECWSISGGNAGMTKGGTGDVLAGLIAALCCNNDPLLATIAGSYINKQAGDNLYTSVGPFFNASDLAQQIPITMKNVLSL